MKLHFFPAGDFSEATESGIHLLNGGAAFLKLVTDDGDELWSGTLQAVLVGGSAHRAIEIEIQGHGACDVALCAPPELHPSVEPEPGESALLGAFYDFSAERGGPMQRE